jgi:hypothetical protein
VADLQSDGRAGSAVVGAVMRNVSVANRLRQHPVARRSERPVEGAGCCRPSSQVYPVHDTPDGCRLTNGDASAALQLPHLLSITKMRDVRIVNIVIPAKTSPKGEVSRNDQAGIHCLLTDAAGSPLSRGRRQFCASCHPFR